MNLWRSVRRQAFTPVAGIWIACPTAADGDTHCALDSDSWFQIWSVTAWVACEHCLGLKVRELCRQGNATHMHILSQRWTWVLQ